MELKKYSNSIFQNNRIRNDDSKPTIPLDAQQEQVLAIQPAQICFQDVLPGKEYNIEIVIRNRTNHIVKYKVYGPKQPQFKVEHDNLPNSLSPGLLKKLKISFCCKDENDYYDQFKIMSQNKSYTVPMKATHSFFNIKYNTLIQGNIVATNTKQKFSTSMTNLGKRAKIRIIKQNTQNINISPDQFVIESGHQQEISVMVVPNVAGIYRHKLLVEINEHMGEPIHLVYSASQFKFFLTSPEGRQINQLDIGYCFYGQKKSIHIIAVNNTPETLNLKSKIRLGWKFNESALQSPQQLGLQCSSTVIEVVPSYVQIKPFSKCPLNLICSHEISAENSSKVANFAKRQESKRKTGEAMNSQIQSLKMMDQQFHETLITDFGEKKLYCSLKVTCGFPLIKIQPACINFGQISLKMTDMRKIKIRNIKQNLPIKLSFPKVFSCEVIPNSITIQPNSQQQFQIYVTPTSFGVFNTSISCYVCNIYKIDIPVTYSVPSQQKKQSISAYSASCQPLKQISYSSLINKTKFDTRITRSTHKQNKMSKRNTSAQWIKTVHPPTPKQNVIQSASEVFYSQKMPSFEGNDGEQQLISGGDSIFKLPKKKDTLFVTRKIDKYEPYKSLGLKHKPQNREISTQIRKIPKNKKQHQQICKQLPVQALRNVNVTEKIIFFGKVFVHSKITKQFQIVNNNEFSIQVKLTSNHQFLTQTDTQPHVISGKSKSKFNVVLVPKVCGEFQSLIDYTINGVHHFRFLVQAEVELVTLCLSKFNLKLNYQDDTKDMLLTDTFQLTNEGNTEAHFQIEQNTEQLTVQPKTGVLASGQSTPILVTYNSASSESMPSGQPKNIKDYNKPTMLNIDERIIVKVKNGVDMFLRVQSNTPEPKCYIKQTKVNFGCCMVPTSKTKSFVLRNLGRSVCLYEIDYAGSQNLLQFDAPKGKVLPQSSKQILVTYKSNNISEINSSFKVVVRGGLIINVPFHAQSVAPKISIVEPNFDFGQISCGSIGMLPISIKNDSETLVELIFDLLNKRSRGLEYLDISFDSTEKQEKIASQKNTSHTVVHKIKVQAKSTFKFYLVFQPSLPGFYEFQLPIYIQNFIKNDMIVRNVTCYAKQPKFFLEPAVIKFKKKIINDKQNACFHPLVEFVTLKNPSDAVLKWKIQMPKTDSGKKLCFQVQNKKGEVKAKSWQCINIAFNPYEEGIYCYRFPVLIYNWQKGDYVQEAEIKVEGQGQYPILLFDRKELILPVVPLQVQSVGMFKIINEGYETIDIKHRICSLDELLLIPDLILFYPQGSKMGINKKQLYVIVKFVAKKPVSFTVKLQIYDGCRIYQLPISGTSDNSLFTTFPFLSDKQNLYRFQSQNDSITLRSIDSRNIIDKLHSHYDQVTEIDYQLPCQIIRRWINTILKDQKVMRFPQDIVNSNQVFLRFLYKITNKKELEKVGVEVDTQDKFYQWVIRILKSMGCLLNHIRPYFLLPKQSFFTMFQVPSLRHMCQTYKKYYRVIHLQSWIILFYQVVSNFWYNPQKVKTTDLKSNIYSTNQMQVLKWIRQIYLEHNQGDEHKFMDLNKDFKDCFAPIYALYHYNFIVKNQSLEGLNRHAMMTSHDYAANIRILYSMMAKANLIPLISQDQFQNIKQKQMFMLLYQLYESLPQQLPKTSPIIFTCQLGQRCMKYIQIKNPSNKFVNYWIRIEGSTDYSAKDEESIRIQPKSSYKLCIEFRSRVSHEEVAYLVLFNKKQLDNYSGIGCSLVFQLRSQIIGRKSIKKLDNLRCAMYESTSIKIPVQNTFNDKEYGNFKIILSEQMIEWKDHSKLINFYVEVDTLKIRRNTTSYIELFYSPMILKSVRCFIIFCDAAVGQFQYEITGIPEVPKPLQQIKLQNPVYLNTQQNIEISLPVYNNLLIKSMSLMQQKMQTYKALNRVGSNKSGDIGSRVMEDDKEELMFKVEVNMDPKILQFIKFPNEITIFHRKKSKTDMRNKLKIQCNFNVIIKDLTLDFVLLSQDKRDVRRFKALVNVTSPPILSNLIMKTNARTPLVQQIPFENSSNKDWKISCQILQMQTNQFSLKQNQICHQKDYICKKNSQISSYFTYNPSWISESSCKLKLTNQITNEQIIYSIKGISQEPLSDDHLFFSTFTGKSNLHSIQIKNPYGQKLSYRVVTDLSQIQCSPEIAMEPSQKTNFSVIVAANSPGVFIGYLKFVDKLGRYFWYSVTIEAEDQVVYEESILMEGLIDEEIEKVLEFKNTISKCITYKTDIDSQHLTGEKSFDIKPYSSYLYRLKFKPRRTLNQQSTIRIFCPEKGAHMYRIQMIAHQQYKKHLSALKVEVGRTGFREFKLNQMDNKNHFSYHVSNPHFYVECADADANGEATVRLFYKPITEGLESCVVKVMYGFNRTKVYQIEGMGIAPYTVQTVQFESVDLNPVLKIIKFKNPYQKSQAPSTEQFSCSIQKNQMKFFNFVGYGQKWETKIADILAIPIQFKPQQDGYFESMLTVQTDQYRWQYLLKGSCTSELKKNHFDQEIKCKVGDQCIKVFFMEVSQFLQQQGIRPNRIQVHHPDSKVLGLVKSWLKLKIDMNDPREDCKSTIYLRFKPTKPLKQIVTFSLFSHIQQSIKLNKKIKLNCQPPQPLQVIPIQISSIKSHIFNIPLQTQVFKIELSECKSRMQKGDYFESKIIEQKHRNMEKENEKEKEKENINEKLVVQLKFNPSNCTFNFKSNLYTDMLILESECGYWSFKVEVTLKNNFIRTTKNVKK